MITIILVDLLLVLAVTYIWSIYNDKIENILKSVTKLNNKSTKVLSKKVDNKIHNKSENNDPWYTLVTMDWRYKGV